MYLKRKWFVMLEFNQQHGPGVMTTHLLRLVIKSAVIQRADEVVYALPFDADVRRQNVITNLTELKQ